MSMAYGWTFEAQKHLGMIPAKIQQEDVSNQSNEANVMH